MAAKYSSHAAAQRLLEEPAKSVFKEPMFWAPVAAMGAGALFGTAQRAVERFQNARSKARAYKEMLDLHPHLKKERDPQEVQRVYRSLHNINPMMAHDPLVAGAWVDNVIESNRQFGDQSNQALLEAVKDLAGIRNQLSSAMEREGKMRGFDASQIPNVALDSFQQAHKSMMEQHGAKAQLMQAGQEQRRIDAARREAERVREERHRLELERARHKFSSAETPEGQRLLAALR